PLPQATQLGRHRPKGPYFLARLTAWRAYEQARHHRCLMDIQATTALHDRLHLEPPSDTIQRSRRPKDADTAIRPSRFRVRHKVVPKGGAGQSRPAGSKPPHEGSTSVRSPCTEPPSGWPARLLPCHATPIFVQGGGRLPAAES